MKDILRSAARIFFGKLMPQLSYPVIKGPLKGAKFILGTHGGEGGGATVYFNMIEPMQTKLFAETINKGDVLFDVGANVGYYTVLGSKLAGSQGKVFSFEPLVRNISFLYRHVKLNNLTNVTIIPSACADVVSVASFLISSNTAMGQIDSNASSTESKGQITIVSTVTLDEVSDKLKTVPDVIKIDVEGAELSVLKGAQNIILVRKPVIFLSVHSSELRTHCLQYLEQFGYDFLPLEKDGANAMEYLCKASKSDSRVIA